MTLIVVSDNSKIGTGIQIGLSVDNQGDPDSLLVTAGSTVASTTAAAVVGLADGHSIDVEGTVVGEDIAISLGFGGHSSGHHLVIGKTGYVSNSLAPSAAVVINAHDSTVDNAGTIRGQTRGLEFQGGSNSDSSNINNSGLIEAADFAIVHAASSDQRVGLNNTGEIRATNIWAAQTYSYYSSGSAQDSVYNSGLMVGEVFLGGGNDVYDGRGGRVLFGVSGLTGSVDGGASADTLIGGEFSDILAGGDDNDEINGGAGGDQLAGDEGDDTLFGEDGNDAIGGGIGNDTMSGGLGDDQLGGVAGDDTLNGDAGNDTLNGGAGKDTISGGDGDDQLNGGADDDTLSGSAGNDTLNGDAGKDTMSGGLGNDQLNGGADSDTMAGDAGNDALNGGGGADTMDGAAGNDIPRRQCR
jgi:Ca2+-binding RTX toxin-like protein